MSDSQKLPIMDICEYFVNNFQNVSSKSDLWIQKSKFKMTLCQKK